MDRVREHETPDCHPQRIVELWENAMESINPSANQRVSAIEFTVDGRLKDNYECELRQADNAAEQAEC